MRVLYTSIAMLSYFTLFSQERNTADTKYMIEVKEENRADSLNSRYAMQLEPLCPSKGYDECMGIVLDKKTETIYFATDGKNLKKFNLVDSVQAETIITIKEATDVFNDEYGDTFLHDMKLGMDGYIYAVAENRILKIDVKKESYETIVNDGFQGPWGAYGIELDDNGNIIVGDHYGGIHIFLKDKDWAKITIIESGANNLVKLSFGGLKLDGNKLYHLDFESSLLITSTLEWKQGLPEVTRSKTLYVPLNYPEYLQIWNGDVFVKAARENKMARVRNNKIIQEINFKSDMEVSPIVTFRLDVQDDAHALFYGTSWGPNGTLYMGELPW